MVVQLSSKNLILMKLPRITSSDLTDAFIHMGVFVCKDNFDRFEKEADLDAIHTEIKEAIHTILCKHVEEVFLSEKESE